MPVYNGYRYARPDVHRSPRNISAGAPAGSTDVSTTVDLYELSLRDPEAASLGYVINSPRHGGVDRDGDPNTLSWQEFMQGGPRILQNFPQDNVHNLMLRLQRAFTMPAATTRSPQSMNPLLSQRWAQVLAVDLVPTQPQPGPAKAFGGCTLEKRSSEGTTNVILPIPTPTTLQTVDMASFELVVVNKQGQEVDCVAEEEINALSGSETGKYVARLRLVLSRLPVPAYLRWQMTVDSSEGQKELRLPVNIPLPNEIPAQAQPWLISSPMIQKDNPEVARLAATILGRSSTMQALVTETLSAMAELRKPFPQSDVGFQNDALSFLRSGIGECTAHANLFAALMRANGVPCRVTTGIQKGVGQNMHYRNEYWMPDKGWIHVEPQGREIQTPRWEWVETGIVYPSMEQRGRGFRNYEGVQQFSMIAQEVDEDGAPISPSAAKVSISPGLVVRSNRNGQLAIHGAS